MNRVAARPKVEWRAVDGILLLAKPSGITSNHALQRVRRLYRAEKAGHTGSLDPFATGVLPVCFGQATKLAGLLLESHKRYRARLELGSRTATGDLEGGIIESQPVPSLAAATVRAVLARFVGPMEQVPPMYSALKRAGEPLYALARRGVEVERAPRPIEILALSLEKLEERALEFIVHCSKGTYVRTLGEDLARALGTVGHLAALERLEVGAFGIHRSYTLADLESAPGSDAELDARLLPLESALAGYPRVALDAEGAGRFRHGARVAIAGRSLPEGDRARAVCVYDADGRLLGLGEPGDDGASVAPRRLLCAAA